MYIASKIVRIEKEGHFIIIKGTMSTDLVLKTYALKLVHLIS